MKTIQRIDDWDIAKGIGILLVVMGHLGIPPMLSNAIYLFHMPLFFILSGLLFAPKTGMGEFVRKKAKHLLLPYALFTVLFVPLRVWEKVGLEGETDFSFSWHCLSPGFFDVPLWFLPALFIVLMLVFLICRVERWKRRAGDVLWGLLAAGGYVLARAHMELPLYITQALLGLGFFYPAFRLRERIAGGRGNGWTVLGALAVMAWAVYGGMRTDMAVLRVSANPLLYVLPALAGSWLVLCLSGWMAARKTGVLKRVLCMLGRNSMFIFAVHWPLLVLLYSLFGVTPFAGWRVPFLWVALVLASLLMGCVLGKLLPGLFRFYAYR